MTEQGFFDLAKVQGLYVAGAGQFLRNLRKKNKLKQEDIAKIIGVTRPQITHWEKNKCRLPLQSLVRIAETVDISRDIIYKLIDENEIFLNRRIPVRIEKIKEIIRFLRPYTDYVKVALTKCSDAILNHIKSILNVKFFFYTKGNNNNQAQIASTALNSFLTTFFNYIKYPKIQLPLTDEVELWYHKGIDLKRALICPLLQTDGCIEPSKQSYLIAFHGNNKNLHDYFIDAIYYEYKKLPSSYFMPAATVYRTRYTISNSINIIDDVLKLAGNAKTSPAPRQTVENYLKESQPHLNYLINASATEQKIALRIWASAEGYIGVKRNKTYIYPVLEISCTHPVLVTQLQQIATKYGIVFNIKRLKNWSGFVGLSSESIKNILKFLKLGGFIKGVKISSKSKYHEGIDKDVLLLGILEFKKRELENCHLKKLTIQKVHNRINRIIENREYKSEEYYISHFSSEDMMS